MIVISIFDPDQKRSTQDEEQLTVLLAALLFYRSFLADSLRMPKDETTSAYRLSQKEALDKVIQTIYPLLGLSAGEVFDLMGKVRPE